jgi:hypothetical protein
MIDMGLVVLQNPTDFGKVQGLCSEECPASSDTCPAISIKDEILSDTEEKYPDPITFVGIKDEPEVSCVSVPILIVCRNRFPCIQ